MNLVNAVFPKKLSQQMILSLTIIVSVVGVSAAYVHVRTQQRQLLDAMVLGAEQLSGSITSATWHAMLADQRESAYRIMETIAQKQGIHRIRIFNKEGRTMFSTLPGDSGQVDKDAEACSMCHTSLPPLVRVDAPSRTRIYRSNQGTRVLGMVTPIYNEPSCSDAACHAHPRAMHVLGVLDISLDLAAIDEEVASIRLRVFAITAIMIFSIGLFVVFFTKKFVETPVRTLVERTHEMSITQLDTPVEINSSEEFGELARSFDAMRIRLKVALEEINLFTQELETKVEERTQQLKAAHQRLLQTDRLASLGQLAASVAHEINNPLSGVLNLAMLLQRIVGDGNIPEERREEVRKYLAQIKDETARVGRIVQDLLAFSRRSKPQQSSVNLNSLVDSTINLLDHKLRLMNVSVERHLAENLPPIRCDPSQMQQVIINLVMNAAEACQQKEMATIFVSTEQGASGREVLFSVKDNGEGIPPHIRDKIFEPFFTTKGVGKGVGLGLAVVYGIVEAHKGAIDLQTKVGEGTVFTVMLPREVDVLTDPAPEESAQKVR